MDKIEPPFYTDENWGKQDQKNIWGSFISPKDTIITYYFVEDEEPWFADDDTDIEYMYQHLLDIHNVSILSPVKSKKGGLIIYTPMKLHQKEKTFYGFQMRLLFILCLMDFLLHKQANQKTTLIIL